MVQELLKGVAMIISTGQLVHAVQMVQHVFFIRICTVLKKCVMVIGVTIIAVPDNISISRHIRHVVSPVYWFVRSNYELLL